MSPTSFVTGAAVALVARLALAGVFIPSAIGKLRDMRGFARGVADYRLLPMLAARAVAALLPAAELALGLALLLGLALPLAGAFAALLLIGFIAAVTINLRRGRAIACNCHGIAGTATISWGTVARNLLLLLFSVGLAALAPTGGSATVWQADLALVAGPASALIALLVIAACLALTQLVEWGVDIAWRGARLTAAHRAARSVR